MKKFKLLAFVALALVAVMALSSCGTVGNLNKVFNEDYVYEAEYYKSAQKISDLKDYGAVRGNDYFVVFYKTDSDGNVTTAVYNMLSNSIIKRVESDEDIVYSVDFVSYNIPICVITSTTIPDDIDEEAVVTKTYYDVNGKEILSIDPDDEAGAPKVLSDEIVIINAAVYTIDSESNAVSKKMDIPAYVSVDNLYCAYVEDYFYAMDGSSVVIYDDKFTPVATWVVPSYAEDLEVNILNNGGVLAQYSVELAEDAMFYDYLENGVKYDLVSKIVTVKGKVKNVNLDYVVNYVIPNVALYDEDADENEYTDKFDNLAAISKIKDKKLDKNSYNWDVVLMNNSAKAQQSLKIVDGQDSSDFFKIADDLFWIETVYGAAIVNSKGDVQFQITNDNIQIYGKYIVATNAIYNLSFEKIYDLGANDAEIIDVVDGTIFVKAGDDEEYTIYSFNDDVEKKVVFTYDEDEEIYFEIVENIGYVIYEFDNGETTYEYYSANGTKLLETEDRISTVAIREDVMIVSVYEDGDLNFYALKK